MKRRRGKSLRCTEVLALALAPLLALALTGLASALWKEDLYIVGRVETAVWRQEIGSTKVVKPVGYDEGRAIASEVVNDHQTLVLKCANVSSGWHVWAGLLIQNVGTVPTRVLAPAIAIEAIDGAPTGGFEVKEFFYGPYDRGDHKEVWGGVKINDLPFSEWKGPGEVVLWPNQKAVIWVELRYEGELAIDQAIIRITIRHDLA